MPVRSLSSSVLKWPDRPAVEEAFRRWACDVAARRPELLRAGFFGSYARGDWGVGSDLDVVLITDNAVEPFERRSAQWDLTELPVPVDVLVYTPEEWQALRLRGGFGRTADSEIIWVYERSRPGAGSPELRASQFKTL